MANSYAMSQSDLVIIPVQPSQLDADEAAKTLQLIARQRKATRMVINCAILWQRMSGAIVTKSAKDIQQQFAEAGIPALSERLLEREAYRAMFSHGCTLEGLPNNTAGIKNAKINAAMFSQEIVELWRTKNG